MASALFEELQKADRLPSVPGVALEIIDLIQNDDVEVEQLAEVLGRDPALTAKLLKTANSSLFGASREISNIHRAITMLGLRTVNLLALSFSLCTAGDEEGEHFDHRAFWKLSAITTTAARHLASRIDMTLRDEAFLAGLLCDFGQLVLADGLPDRYAPVLEAAAESDEPVHEIERRLLETDHMEIGRDLLDAWGLPEAVCQAIGAHHEPGQLAGVHPRGHSLAQILHVASTCAELYAGTAEVESAAIGLKKLAATYFNMDGEACSELLSEIEEQLPAAARLFEVELDDPRCLAEICMRASQLVVKETLALNQQVQDATTQAKQLEERALRDALTGLGNRGFFDDTLGEELGKARDQGTSLGLLMLDLDHFKSVNDSYGHSVGDELLRVVGRVVGEAVSGDEWAARYGGEEIVCVLPGCTLEALGERAEQIRRAIAEAEIQTEQGPLHRTASIGCCWLGRVEDAAVAVRMVEAADRELYRAKSEGRDRVFVTQGV